MSGWLCGRWVGGLGIGRKVEEIEAVRTRCWTLWVGGWMGWVEEIEAVRTRCCRGREGGGRREVVVCGIHGWVDGWMGGWERPTVKSSWVRRMEVKTT